MRTSHGFFPAAPLATGLLWALSLTASAVAQSSTAPGHDTSPTAIAGESSTYAPTTHASSSLDQVIDAWVAAALETHPQRHYLNSQRARASAERDAAEREGGHTTIGVSAGVMLGGGLQPADMYGAEVMYTLPNFRARASARAIETAALHTIACEESLWAAELRQDLSAIAVQLEANRQQQALLTRANELSDALLQLAMGEARTGVASEARVIRAQQLRIEEAQRADALADEAQQLRARLYALTSLDIDPAQMPVAPSWAWEADDATLARATSTESAVFNPDHLRMLQTQAELDATRAQIQAQGRAEWAVGAMYALEPMAMGHDTLMDSHEIMASASVTLPKPRAVQAQLRAIDEQRTSTGRSTAAGVRQSHAQRASLQSQIQTTTRSLQRIEAGLQPLVDALQAQIERAYRFGNTDVGELIDAYRAAIDIEALRIEMRATRAQALVALDYLSAGAVRPSSTANADSLASCDAASIQGGAP